MNAPYTCFSVPVETRIRQIFEHEDSGVWNSRGDN
jgi:hypothetical protein